MKIWTCPECEKKIDSVKEKYEQKQLRLFLLLFVLGFILSVILLKGSDSTWGLAIFLGFFAGAALGLLSMPIAKFLTQKETNGLKNEIRNRLNEHPEVIAVHNEGYDRSYD